MLPESIFRLTVKNQDLRQYPRLQLLFLFNFARYYQRKAAQNLPR